MKQIATFFRNRDTDTGETYQFNVTTEKAVYQFSVYCRTPVSSNLFEDQERTQNEFSEYKNDVLNAVLRSGEGGIIVSTSSDSSRTIDVRCVGTASGGAPQHYAVLAPGKPAYWVEIEKRRSIGAGSHVIVPVDGEGEDHLAAFMEQLPWFSPDFEAVVLNAIRRPSLDARMNAVEKRVYGRTPDTDKPFYIRWLSDPAAYGGIALFLLLLLLATNGFLLSMLYAKKDNNSAETATDGQTAADTSHTGSKTTTESGDAQPAAPKIVTETRELLKEVREHAAGDHNLLDLYEKHFKNLDNSSVSDEEIAALFNDADKHRDFLAGIIALQALKLEPKPPDQSFGNTWKDVHDTRPAFALIDATKISHDKNGLHLLAVLACRLGGSPQRVGLPDFDGDSCDKLSDDDVTNDLIALKEFVRKP